MNKLITYSICLIVFSLLFGIPVSSNAEPLTEDVYTDKLYDSELSTPSFLIENTPEPLTSFRAYKSLPTHNNAIPQVVEIIVSELDVVNKSDVAIYNASKEQFEGFLLFSTTRAIPSPYTISVSGAQNSGISHTSVLKDKNSATSIELLPGSTRIMVNQSSGKAQYNGTDFSYEQNVIPPESISVSVMRNGEEVPLVTKRSFNGQNISFPTTSATEWIITLYHSQPIRLAELEMNEINMKQNTVKAVRYLAQPGQSYYLFMLPNNPPHISTPETGNFFDKDTKADITVDGIDTLYSLTANPAFKDPDDDNDGIINIEDNCPRTPNPEQIDANTNGIGDACDDFDLDDVQNSEDNCINIPNSNQLDSDNDGTGDACDDEESRLTEKYPWLPWVSIGYVALMTAALFGFTYIHSKKEHAKKEEEDIKKT